MNDNYNNIDERSKDASHNIRIAFDENAWKKMESLLDQENRSLEVIPVLEKAPVIQEKNGKNRSWLFLMGLFLMIGSIFFITVNNTENKKTTSTPIAETSENAITDKNKQNKIPASQQEPTQIGKENKSEEQTGNKNFSPQATRSKQTTIIVIENKNTIKKTEGQTSNQNNSKADLNRNSIGKKDDLPFSKQKESKIALLNNTILPLKTQDSIKYEVRIKQSEAKKDSTEQQEINSLFTKRKPDSVNRATVNKDTNALTSKSKLFKNIGFTIFASPETNTVNFKESDKITLNYGAGINYNMGRHLTLSTQFIKARKVYVTDRKGYNPPDGSIFLPVDTLNVRADCKVLDILLNIKYNFNTNTTTGFFISIGISSYIMKKEKYDFSYYDRGVYKTRQGNFENQNKHGFSNLNISAGYQHWLNKKMSVGIEPYLKLPINGVGIGKVKLISAGVSFSFSYQPFRK